mmetsp:Transcript_15117/g.51858  ORF Transcript_15117/g.51858 Transcript_15117/m.51858 type:complete len:475 (-) Transcript_15117:52-1476(-)
MGLQGKVEGRRQPRQDQGAAGRTRLWATFRRRLLRNVRTDGTRRNGALTRCVGNGELYAPFQRRRHGRVPQRRAGRGRVLLRTARFCVATALGRPRPDLAATQVALRIEASRQDLVPDHQRGVSQLWFFALHSRPLSLHPSSRRRHARMRAVRRQRHRRDVAHAFMEGVCRFLPPQVRLGRFGASTPRARRRFRGRLSRQPARHVPPPRPVRQSAFRALRSLADVAPAALREVAAPLADGSRHAARRAGAFRLPKNRRIARLAGMVDAHRHRVLHRLPVHVHVLAVPVPPASRLPDSRLPVRHGAFRHHVPGGRVRALRVLRRRLDYGVDERSRVGRRQRRLLRGRGSGLDLYQVGRRQALIGGGRNPRDVYRRAEHHHGAPDLRGRPHAAATSDGLIHRQQRHSLGYEGAGDFEEEQADPREVLARAPREGTRHASADEGQHQKEPRELPHEARPRLRGRPRPPHLDEHRRAA